MRMAGQPAGDIWDAVWGEVKAFWRPVIPNQIDETAEIKLDVSPATLAELAKAVFGPMFGARPSKPAIPQRIEYPVGG